MRILSLFLLGTWTGMAKADLAVTNGSGSSVSVFRNTGSVGTISYAAKVDFTTGSFPYSVSIGDLDGDGKADLALANEGSNTVSVFRNTGSAGTISYAAKVDFTTGSLPFSVSIGDLDGDGKADLAVANYSSNTVSVFRNTGSPGTISYAAKVDFTTGSGSGPNSVSIGDLDGDGKADLAVANYNSNTVSVIRNTGSAGTISYAAKVDFTTGFAPYSVSIGDLDGDGKADLAVANGSGSSVSVFRNTGSAGTISYAAKVDFTTGLFPYSVSIGDLDGDGKADLAIANQSSNTVSVFRNTGSAGTISYAAKVDFATGSDPSSASIGDLDEDGKADLAVANASSNTVSVFRNTGSAGTISYATKVDFATGISPLSVSIGDLDGDGKADLAVANKGSNTVSVFRNTGSAGTISYAAKVDFAADEGSYSVSIGDLDGDGKADLAVANYNSNTVSVFRNTGSVGTISYAAKVDFATGTNPASVSIGDLDGDGKADLAVANQISNTVSVFRNTGSAGTISYAAKVDFTTGSAPISVSIGDLDGDGKADLAVANYNSNTVSVFRNTGSAGTISYAAKVDFATGSGPYSVSIGDLDGDGKADLAVANASSNTVSVIRNNPVFPQTITFPALSNKTFGDAPFTLSATASSSLTVSYASSNTSVATVSGNTVTIVGAGTTTITASQAGNTNFAAATSVPQTLTVNQASQTITFAALANKTFGDASFTLSATASSGLTVGYASSNTSVATVSGDTVTIVGAGTTTITASQAGNTNFAAAASVPQTLTVNQASQTITFAALANKNFGDAPFTLSATASSGLAVSYSSSNTSVATLSGNTVTIVGAGTTTLTASQAGNTNYNAAPDVPQPLNVISVKQNQTITFNTLPDRTLGDAVFTLTAAASSSLAVSYSTTSDKITISGSQVTLVKAGRAAITANQAGNASFNPAPGVERNFCIKPAKPIITASGVNTETITLTSSATAGNQWFKDGTAIANATNSTLTVTTLGVYKVQAKADDCLSEFSTDYPIIVTGDVPTTQSGIYVLPNPVDDELELRGIVGQLKNYQLFDMTGRSVGIVLDKQTSTYTASVQHLRQGMYVLRVQQGDQIHQIKFVKK
ncbi:MAG: VCBS repeat-containing protein [Cytophagales bacterium]|nr:VCBS repeat-containing protein [Cytophagales bacterium]